MKKKLRVAFDFGGVIAPKMSERSNENGGLSLEPGPESAAFEVMAKLVKKLGAENCCIISRVNSDTKVDASWAWLHHWKFFEKTGFLVANVIIYKGDRQQKAQYVRAHNINVMVDDRFEVLSSMDQEVMLVAFRPDPIEQHQFVYEMKMRIVYIYTEWRQIEYHFEL